MRDSKNEIQDPNIETFSFKIGETRGRTIRRAARAKGQFVSAFLRQLVTDVLAAQERGLGKD